MLHPGAQILLWIFMTLGLQFAHPPTLVGMGVLLLLGALVLAADRLRQLLRRTRWIMVSLLLIYAWTTPGMPAFESVPQWSPTIEGLQDGALQLSRLLFAIAALAILLARLDTSQLMSGMYWLCGPLSWVGFARERFAVRLALTLHYAESAMFSREAGWRNTLDQLLAPVEVVPGLIKLPHYRVRVRDGVALMLGLLMLITVAA